MNQTDKKKDQNLNVKSKQVKTKRLNRSQNEDITTRILYLLKRFREGDTQAYEKLYYTVSPPIFKLFSRLLPSVEDAEDATQDVFIKLWNSREKIDHTRDIRPLLFLMAKQATASYYRKAKQQDNFLTGNVFEKDTIHTTLDDMIAKETELLTRIIIERMPPQRREIYLLSFEKGLSNSDIAKKIGLKPEIVAKQLYHAREQLKKGMVLFLFWSLSQM